MTAGANDMMSLLDSPFYPFDNMNMNIPMPMPMNLAINNAMPPAYPPAPVSAPAQHAPTPALASSSEARFAGDDIGMVSTAPLTMPTPTMPTPTMDHESTTLTGPNLPTNTLTEFTKRRGWAARVVSELSDLLHILNANGKIKHVSPSIERLTGYETDEVLNKFLTDFLHPDDVGVFNAEFNDAIAKGTPLRLFYRLKKKDGNYAIFETVGHAHIAAAKFAPNPNNQAAFCQAVFMMARPYPQKNAALLDSFLEHKMENERLRKRISQLKREEVEEVEESNRSYMMSQEVRSESDGTARMSNTPYYQGALPDASASAAQPVYPASASATSSSLTRENLEGIAGGRPDSIREKMARYEGGTHVDPIEMFTGLRYTEGERSRDLAGNGSPTLIKGDAGIIIPMDRDPRTSEKKKKIRVAEEYVCTDCGMFCPVVRCVVAANHVSGTLESPEWRKGPSGPKTLCNACGLRWAKKEKKKNAANNLANGGQEGLTPMENGNY